MAHIPVLLAETISALNLRADAVCIDGTLGGAGHAEAVLDATGPRGRLLGMDADPASIDRARTRLARFGDRVVLQHANFRNLAEVAGRLGFSGVDAVLLDLGVSSYQLDQGERGFSFMSSGPLDMRMDPGQALSADDIVNQWSVEALAEMIYRFGEEPRSRRIARAIVDARPLSSTAQLADVISRAVGGRRGHRIHPATKVFQSLRLAVNDELAALSAVLPQAVSLLVPGGRLGVIAFHSLEDRLVKQFIQREARDCICDLEPGLERSGRGLPCRCGHRATIRPVGRKPIVPTDAEVRSNPRSRSARLRVAERI